jgi:hypothetical protein
MEIGASVKESSVIGAYPWPQQGDMVFAQPTEPEALVADLTQQRGSWWSTADGYREAAKLLVAAARSSEDTPDHLFRPLAFLWRHYLELALKSLLPNLRELKNRDREARDRHHQLAQLWREARPRLAAMGSHADLRLLDAVGSVIGQIDAVDPTGEVFRYPVDACGEDSLPSSLREVDLGHLGEVMERTAAFFDACGEMTGEYIGFKHEMEAEHLPDWGGEF